MVRRSLIGVLVVAVIILLWGAFTDWRVVNAQRTSPAQQAAIQKASSKIKPLHETISKPGPSDWLAQHKEPGQTFFQYQRARPTLPVGVRKTLYIQPLGEFSPTQRKIVNLTAEFLGKYYNIPVKVSKDLPQTIIPAKARRVHPTWGMEQFLSTYILDVVLAKRLPKDAAAYLALTAHDLYPDPNWNFVFGQASLQKRVGVWSMYRNGDPDKDEENFRLVLLRTLKTAAHETGHMFSIKHCTAYECNMCGSNHQEESDRRPITLCPECVSKVWWGMKADPLKRYQELAEFCKENGLEDEQKKYENMIDVLSQ